MEANGSLLRFVASDDASPAAVRVLAGQRSPQTVSGRLTGKFCEHLWHNVDRGMEAQVLKNPTFAAFPFAAAGTDPDGGIRRECDEQRIAELIRARAERDRWPDPERLVEARQAGLAHWWIAEGAGEAIRASPDAAAGGNRAQRVEAGRAGAGIAQWTHLPLHRVRQLAWRIVARSPDLPALRLLLFAAGDDEPCAAAEVAGLSGEWATCTGTLAVPPAAAADEIYRLALVAPSPGQFVVARVLLYPADHVGGADPDVIRLLRESRLPLLRWPGGNFVSGYHWADGVGPVDDRPTTPNLAWGHPEPNLFGTDEFVAFCRAVGCEPLICVNAGTGTPEEAARWVEYCNAPAEAAQGARRAANGHREPYGVRLWEIGNELYGRWQMGWTTPAGYADRCRRFAEAMRAADGTIEVWACGALSPPEWNRRVVEANPEIVSTITDHPLLGGRVVGATDPLDVYRDFLAVPDVWGEKYQAVRRMMLDAGVREPHLAITELQLFAHLAEADDDGGGAARPLTHETLVSPPTLAEALYDTLWFHMAVRAAPFIEVITHSATVNHGGGLRKQRERVYANPCHYAWSLLASFAGARPVAVEARCAELAAPGVLDCTPAGTKRPAVDALAAVTPDGELLVSLVNCGTEAVDRLDLSVDGFATAGAGELWRLGADVPWAANTLEAPERIVPVREEIACDAGGLTLRLEPYTLLQLRLPPAE